jgi:hypothetical protein
MRSNKDLTPLEQEALDVYTIINTNLPLDYVPKFKDNFNNKKFMQTCKKNRKLRKKKKR